MAILKPISPLDVRSHMEYAIKYVMKESKTDEGLYIGGQNLIPVTADDVIKSFDRTKNFYGKEDGRLAYHWVQSFARGEVTPADAYKIAEEFVERVLPGYEVLIATHVDREHIHTHLIWNSVSIETGKKYHQPKTLLYEWGNISDELCKKYGLSVLPQNNGRKNKTKRRDPSFPEVHPDEAFKMTTRNYIYEDIDIAISQAKSVEDFYRILQYEMGYKVKRGENVAHTAICPPDRKDRFFRLYKFERGYTEEDIERRISEEIQKRKESRTQVQQPQHRPTRRAGGEEIRITSSPNYYPRVSYMLFPSSHASLYRYTAYIIRRYRRGSLQRTYFSYRHVLRSVQRESYPRYPSPTLRKDLQQLDKINQQTVLLATHKIETTEQLLSYRSELSEKITEEYKKIRRLNDRLSRRRKEPLTDEQREEIQEQILSTRKNVAPLVREKKLCDDIEQRSDAITSTVEEEIRLSETRLKEIEENREKGEIKDEYNNRRR